jgi:hypothetical protein
MLPPFRNPLTGWRAAIVTELQFRMTFTSPALLGIAELAGQWRISPDQGPAISPVEAASRRGTPERLRFGRDEASHVGVRSRRYRAPSAKPRRAGPDAPWPTVGGTGSVCPGCNLLCRHEARAHAGSVRASSLCPASWTSACEAARLSVGGHASHCTIWKFSALDSELLP